MSGWIEFDNKLIWLEPGAVIIGPQVSIEAPFFWALTLSRSGDYTNYYWSFPAEQAAQKAYDKLKARLVPTRRAYYDEKTKTIIPYVE